MRVAFVGPMGTGKSTQAPRLSWSMPFYNRMLPLLKRRYEDQGVLRVVDARQPLAGVAEDVPGVLGHLERAGYYAV